MSKKKSYMDKENILKEGIFDMFKIFKLLGKGNNKEKLSKKEKALLKNPAFTKELAKFDKMIKKGKADISKEAEKYGIKLKQY